MNALDLERAMKCSNGSPKKNHEWLESMLGRIFVSDGNQYKILQFSVCVDGFNFNIVFYNLSPNGFPQKHFSGSVNMLLREFDVL